MKVNQSMLKKCVCFFAILAFCAIIGLGSCVVSVLPTASAMPFYDLNPKEFCLRSKFFTGYSNSTPERKNNVKVCANALNLTLVDVGGEFSFNKTVGERTEKRGYKKAKIIVNGEFVDGVGGGVCQVSSTLYNALLLSGLEITEYHPHSLPVSYVAPSFDAMVNSGWADLKFVNNTQNPIVITADADGNKLTVCIYGQPLEVRYERESVITESISPPQDQVLVDENGDYPDLFEGESMFLRYGKAGYKSEGYIVAISKNGRAKRKKIRSDKYGATRGIVVLGKAKRQNENIEADRKSTFFPEWQDP